MSAFLAAFIWRWVLVGVFAFLGLVGWRVRVSWALKRSCPLSCGDGCWLACPPSWAAKWLCPPLTWRWVLVGGSAFLARGLVSLDVEVGVGWCVRLVSRLHGRVPFSWALKRSCFPSCGGGCCLVSPPSWALKWFCPPFCGGILFVL